MHRYREKLSRALLDRIDLTLTVPRPAPSSSPARRVKGRSGPRARVVDARRALDEAPPRSARAAQQLLTRAVERLPLSGRGRTRVARVASSIAALAGAGEIEPEHLAEALSYRSPRELSE